jgi:hypothetical protein
MPGLAFGRGAEHRGDVIETLDVRFGRKVQIAPVGLRFARKSILEILFRLAAF